MNIFNKEALLYTVLLVIILLVFDRKRKTELWCMYISSYTIISVIIYALSYNFFLKVNPTTISESFTSFFSKTNPVLGEILCVFFATRILSILISKLISSKLISKDVNSDYVDSDDKDERILH